MSRWRAPVLAALAALALGASPLAAADGFAYATPPGGAGLGDAIGTLVELAGAPLCADVPLLEQARDERVRLALVDAGPAQARQALAHAAGCWWARAQSPGDAAGTVLTRSPRLPQGELGVRWITSALRERRELERMVASLMAPWTGGDAGVGYQAAQGLWPATLDPSGHARLVELLALLERPVPRAPDLVPDPAPDGARPLARPVVAAGWEAFPSAFARSSGVGIALAPGVAALPPPPELPASTLREACATLRAAGLAVAMVQGVVCVDRADAPAPADREHPGSRRRLALLPAAHLLGGTLDGDFLVAGLERAVAAEAWSQPGWGLHWLPEAGALLVAADPATIHAVLDAMDRIDHLGLEAGLASLPAPARGATAPAAGPAR